MPETAPYGSWPSPVSAEIVAENDGRPGWLSHAAGALWWTRPQPAEGGRVALLRLPDGAVTPEVVLPARWNVRSRVHEYGGLAHLVTPDGAVVFAEFTDQRLYRFEPGSDPVALTPSPAIPSGLRYAEPVLSPSGTEVWCVREEHTGPAPTDVRRALVAVPLDGSGDVRVLVEDTHFLACPRPSPDGTRLSWIGWDHPNMPWDATVVRVAPVSSDGVVGSPVTVAGGPSESVPQAEWETADALLVVTDRTGWWNLHRVRLTSDGAAEPEVLCERAEEFAGPLWQLGMRWFAPIGEGEVAVIRGRASSRLNLLDTGTGLLYDLLEDVHTEWSPTLAVSGRTIYGVAASRVEPFEVVAAGGGSVAPVLPSVLSVPVTSLPSPQPRTF
ncbi:acyl-peptide hydrolase, partial [Jiangella anatolica]